MSGRPRGRPPGSSRGGGGRGRGGGDSSSQDGPGEEPQLGRGSRPRGRPPSRTRGRSGRGRGHGGGRGSGNNANVSHGDDPGEGTSSGVRAGGHKRTMPTVDEIANMYHEDDDTDDDEDDSEELNGNGAVLLDEDGQPITADQEDDDNEEEIPRRRLKLKDRIVNSLDKALDASNYNRYVPPSVLSEVTAVREKKKRKNDTDVTITWTNQKPAPRRQGRRPANQILDADAGSVLGRARECLTPVDCFKLFFDDEIIDMILLETNNKIRLFNETFPDKKDVDVVTRVELHAVIGLFMARGYFSWNQRNTELLWDVGKSNPIFVATMSRQRFKQILSFLSMDDSTTRRERFQFDRMAACREVFEVFNTNCGLYMKAAAFVTIDECLYASRTAWAGKCYNKSKPAK